MSNIIYRRYDCRACGSTNLEKVFSLKPTPIGDEYVMPNEAELIQPTYPIELNMCSVCGLAQLADVLNPSILYGKYIYATESSTGLDRHFDIYSNIAIDRCKLGSGSLVVDIGSNDGTLLKHFQNKGMAVLGVEPAGHIATRATKGGIRTIDSFFTYELAHRIVEEYGLAKLVTANNVFANIDDLNTFVKAVNLLLDRDGVFIFESYYLADLIHNKVFDFIYHEHLSSFSLKPIKMLFERYGLELIVVERINTKGGSLRYFIQRKTGPIINDGSVSKMLEFEKKIGLYDKQIFVDFNKKIIELKDEISDFLITEKTKGKSIAGFGASVTCTTLIYHFEIGQYLDFLVDDNISKQGRLSPGLHLPVYPATELCNQKPDYALIIAWRFADEIITKNQSFLNDKGTFIVPVPKFKVVDRVK